jgi:orotidine-5'-phosphate decarboxylase
MSKNPIICALDTDDIPKANLMINNVKDHVGAFKLGLEFFCGNGPRGVEEISKTGAKIFLDLKLHDIPNTVAKAVKQISKLNCFMTTIHLLSGTDVLKAARYQIEECDNKPLLIGVTILTSHLDIADIGIDSTIREEVLRLAELAAVNRLDGIVCSPHEVMEIKKNFGDDLKLIVPGIRSESDAKNDQARTLSAGEALKLGADYLVIGRPITSAPDAALAAQNIYKSIS